MCGSAALNLAVRSGRGREAKPGQDHLESDNAIQLRMASPINDSHATAGDFVEKLVVAKTPFGPDARGCIPIEQPGIDCCFRVDITSYAFSKRFFAGIGGRCRWFRYRRRLADGLVIGIGGLVHDSLSASEWQRVFHYSRLREFTQDAASIIAEDRNGAPNANREGPRCSRSARRSEWLFEVR